MPRAEIIAIGTELLLGETQDTNTAYLARHLRDVGVDIFRATLIGDNPQRIAGAIKEALQRAEIVITTGGLGPTVDDPTRQAVADALELELEFRPELWQQIQDRFKRFNRQATENNRKQAYIPAGSLALENPVGTAPAFIACSGPGVIVSLPGVPREMEYLYHNAVLPYLREHFDLSEIIRAYVLHTAGVGESQVDEWIGDLELLSNPTVGLAAHSGQIDIRITAKGSDAAIVEEMIQAVAAQVIERVGDAIYGSEQETLPGVLSAFLETHHERMVVIECGLKGALTAYFSSSVDNDIVFLNRFDQCSAEDLRTHVQRMLEDHNARYSLGASLMPGSHGQDLHIFFLNGDEARETFRSYGGPLLNAPAWAAVTAMDFARRNMPVPNPLLNHKKGDDGNR